MEKMYAQIEHVLVLEVEPWKRRLTFQDRRWVPGPVACVVGGGGRKK